MPIPCYPDFVPLSIDLKESLHPRLSLTADGVSEFTFSGLYLFRNRYKYRISRDGPDGGFIISGEQPGEIAQSFFMTPGGAPSGVPNWETLESLFASHHYWKNIPESALSQARETLAERGIDIAEDRDNFDYLYYRSDLAQLAGKKYHKKKNLVNQFLHTYSEYEQRPLTGALVPAAIEVLDQWRALKKHAESGDYYAAREALELFDTLPLQGSIFFISGKPAAYCLGESIVGGKMFAIHFEKAVEEYKGVYQFMNQSFAAALPVFFTWINREQDLGDKGLRQAKMTYRPSGFVRKYRGYLK